GAEAGRGVEAQAALLLLGPVALLAVLDEERADLALEEARLLRVGALLAGGGPGGEGERERDAEAAGHGGARVPLRCGRGEESRWVEHHQCTSGPAAPPSVKVDRGSRRRGLWLYLPPAGCHNLLRGVVACDLGSECHAVGRVGHYLDQRPHGRQRRGGAEPV